MSLTYCRAMVLILSSLFILSASAYTFFNEAVDQKLVASQFGTAGLDASFDYLVIGGGTAGLTVATRLAQNPNVSVAVIEVGGFYQQDNGNASIIPAYCFRSANATSTEGTNGMIDWLYETTAQTQLPGNQFHFVRGKCLGGSSARNYMVYNRATKGALQQWADQIGDTSYLWENFLPFYTKSVSYTGPDLTARGGNATNNDDAAFFDVNGGPLSVTYAAYFDTFATYIPAGLEQLGLSHLTQGLNSGALLGYAAVTQTSDAKTGYRSSSQSSFLDLALGTTSITVYGGTMTERIVFDDTKSATGVVVSAGGQTFTLNAGKEVILSAGVVGSPHLLMVSGVGPKDILDQYGIPIIADRPGVGQNLQDGPLIAVEFPVDVTSQCADPITDFLEHGTGPLTSSGADLIAFDKLTDKPFTNISAATAKDLQAYFSSDWPHHHIITGGAGSIYGSLTATFSRGNISLASSSIYVHPLINPAWVSDPRDQELMVNLVKYIRALMATESIKSLITGPIISPPPGVQTDAQILEWVKQNAYSIFHGSCTCKMGKISDPMAVVDSNAKVIGVNKLRVVDISAFAFLTPGEPQSLVYALAEKIAQQIMSGF